MSEAQIFWVGPSFDFGFHVMAGVNPQKYFICRHQAADAAGSQKHVEGDADMQHSAPKLKVPQCNQGTMF